MISIIVPTIKGREDYLNDCKASYAATTDDYELIVVPDRDACGVAWVEGAGSARGEYIHFSADDLRAHAGWWQAAMDVCARGFLPAPRILNTDGTIQSCGGTDGWQVERQTGEATDFSRIPFLHRDQWKRIVADVSPVLRETHYYTDNAVSYAGAKRGMLTGVAREYCFTHSLAQPGRGAGTTPRDRMRTDFERFEAWRSGL